MQLHQQIFSRDASLWSDQHEVQKDIANRLGWLDAIEFSRQSRQSITDLYHRVQQANYSYIVLLGMGGSSLAAEVFKQLISDQHSKAQLTVLDSTCPDKIAETAKSLSVSETLFVVASKSGGTLETRCLFDYFFALVKQQSNNPGQHFLAITDAGSELAILAQQLDFFACFINPSDIGGRYSALSYFGLIPAALLGWNIDKLLDRAELAFQQTRQGDALGLMLGNWLSGDYQRPVHTLNFKIVDDKLKTLFLWIEQLVAESLGKQGQGILPLLESGVMRSSMKTVSLDFGISEYHFSDQNHASIFLRDEYDVAAQFFHWEIATVVAAANIKVNPFDEPNVTEAKQKTSQLLLDSSSINFPVTEVRISDFIADLSGCEYLALLVYADNHTDNVSVLQSIRQQLEQRLSIPVTINFGPRYLHSVGQLHKGGKKQGAFLVLVEQCDQQLDIPTAEYDFNQLFNAQAIGDWQSLKEKGLPAEIFQIEDFNQLAI